MHQGRVQALECESVGCCKFVFFSILLVFVCKCGSVSKGEGLVMDMSKEILHCYANISL